MKEISPHLIVEKKRAQLLVSLKMVRIHLENLHIKKGNL